MDNFVPPKPPQGLAEMESDDLQEFKLEDLDDVSSQNVESGSVDDGVSQEVEVVIEKSSEVVPQKRLSKKGRSFFQRLFGRKNSSGSKLELDDSQIEVGVSDFEVKEASSIDDALIQSGLEDEVEASVGGVDKESNVSEESKVSDVSDVGVLDSQDDLFDESEPSEFKIGSSAERSINKDDLKNIRSALGLDVVRTKSLRESFEEDPSSFESLDDSSDGFSDDSSSDWSDSFNEEIDLSDSFDESPKVNDESLKEKSVERVVSSPVDFSEDIPVFESEVSESGVVVFKNFLNLTQRKVESLIRDSASKKKKDLLDKKREVVLLNSFEKAIKKLVDVHVGLLDKEVDKAFVKVQKRQVVLDKKLEKLGKQEKVINSKEKALKVQESDLLKSKASVEKDVASLNKVLDKLAKDELALKYKIADLDAAKKVVESDLKILKNNFKDEEKSIKAKVADLNSSFASLQADLSSKEAVLNSSIKNKQAELAKLEDELVSTKNKVSAQLSKLAIRESEIDKKQAELNNLIEEERKVLSILELTRESPSYGSLDESSDSFGKANSYDSFLEEIDFCKGLIKSDLASAKLKYNKLRQDLLSSDFDGVEKKSLMVELKKLYGLIAKK